MSTAQGTRNPQPFETSRHEGMGMRTADPQLKEDVVAYLTDYARQNPGHAALFCLAAGFVLGWKLKPW